MKPFLLLLLLAVTPAPAQDTSPAAQRLEQIFQGITRLTKAAPEPAIYSAKLRVESASPTLEKLAGRQFTIKFQPPEKYSITADIKAPYTLSSDGKLLWIHAPKSDLLLEGDTTVPRFSLRPDSTLTVSPPRLPSLSPQVLYAARAMLQGSFVGDNTLSISANAALPAPWGGSRVTLHPAHGWPSTVTWESRSGERCTLRLISPRIESPSGPPESWKPSPEADDKTQRVALSHLTQFLSSTVSNFQLKTPDLPPYTEDVKVIAREGRGRLESHAGAHVLHLAGSAAEMGHQHGTLMKKGVKKIVERILYGVGVASSFEKKRWFFDEIEEAIKRTRPFVDPLYLVEMESLAKAAGIEREECEMANFFPELFHCSGFALMNEASKDGRLYHGRVLDYARGAGLEEHAVVILSQPDYGHAWVSVGYAGFTGSVTAMNEKHIAIGEMGGDGEGHWDGKPMAQLIREAMERATTLEEAVAIFRKGPRTCEYYYVLSDGKTKAACGIKGTPDVFEVFEVGKAYPKLEVAIPGSLLLSAGDRYTELAKRVQAAHGTIDDIKARELMTRPVCMKSNIQSVLFAPESLDFWVAHADSKNVASESRYTPYNLRKLLDSK